MFLRMFSHLHLRLHDRTQQDRLERAARSLAAHRQLNHQEPHLRPTWIHRREVAMRSLSDQDRRALRLADDLQKAVEQWLAHRGVDQSCTVSPFVDPTGQPAVVIKLNAQVACVMIDSLNEQHTRSADGQAPTSPPGLFPRT
jgi:hypothetical protein